jgi:bifunctional non-homologous end joining protein LigD
MEMGEEVTRTSVACRLRVQGACKEHLVALEEYRRKRDFTRTPEPAGDPAAAERSSPTRFFCVQKHLATNLHYDFRIEHDGVLLSWAVPKGPSLDPGTKRLAMHVEDHPLEYGEFEGVIPEGYGAGVVMLWDVGTWEPEVADVDAALRKGDLKMRLNGYKLKGSWVLVRTRGWGGRAGASDDGRSWLLIKHKDEWAGNVDITTFAPNSVKSAGAFRDILAQDAPDIWMANKGTTGDPALETLADVLRKLDRIEPLPQQEARTAAPPARPRGRARRPPGEER